MKIIVKNVAKIIEAQLSLDGLTVIAGYNNMGKSTILKSVYMALNTFRNANSKVNMVRTRSIASYFLNLEPYFDENGYNQLPRELLLAIADKVNEYLLDFSNGTKDNYQLFKRIFFASLEKYREYWPDDFEAGRIHTDSFLLPVYEKVKEICTRDKDMDLKYIGEMYIRNVFKGQVCSLGNAKDALIEIDSGSEHYQMTIKDNKISDMHYNINTEADVFYLPAYNLLDMAGQFVGAKRVYSPEYDMKSVLLADEEEPTLEEYQEIEDNIKVIKDILEEIIQGRLERQPSGNIFFQENGWEDSVSIGNVASGLKTFLIIQAFVEKGRLKRNSILLIDEPETNLHPEWHMKFAEILVLMYKNMGVRSIVNSHSPYFIRALEVKMADYGIKEKGHYYLMEEIDRNLCRAQDVTAETDKIYELMYRPLEYLP